MQKNWFLLIRFLSLKVDLIYWSVFFEGKYSDIYSDINKVAIKSHAHFVGKAKHISDTFCSEEQCKELPHFFLAEIQELVINDDDYNNLLSAFDLIEHALKPTSGGSFSFFCDVFHSKIALPIIIIDKKEFINKVIFENLINPSYQEEVINIFEYKLCDDDKALIEFYEEDVILDLLMIVLTYFSVKKCWLTLEENLSYLQFDSLQQLKIVNDIY